jgi:hypothetical protein
MSWRARGFLVILALRHLVVGGLCLLGPHLFRSTSFTSLRQIAPLRVWGAVLIVTGAQGIGAAVTGGEWWARAVLVASAALTGAWAAGFIAAAITGDLDAPSLPVTWVALVFKDLIIAATPLRTPLEDAIRRHPDIRAAPVRSGV